VAVVLAVAGMVLLSWPNPGAAHANTLAVVPPVPYLGEILTVAGSVLFTVQILALDRFGQNADPVRLTLVMLVAGGVLSLVAGPCIDPGVLRPIDPGGLVRDPTVWWTVSSLVVVSSVLAMHLMNTYQPFVSPATASVIYCTEPLFGTIFSWRSRPSG
jgi:drug/metabolite transporter (DMT)-like permease